MLLQSSQKHLPGASPERLVLSVEDVSSCSFSEATFSCDAARASDCVRDGDVVAVAFMPLNLRLREAGKSYLNSRHREMKLI